MQLADAAKGERAVRVLHVLHDSRRSGVPAVAANLVRSVDRSEVVPSALFAYEGAYSEDLRLLGVKVWSLGKRLPFVWRLNRFLLNVRMLGLLRCHDVVHAHSVKCAWSVIVAKLFGARVIYHLHELPGKIGPVLRSAVAMADCVVFCSRTCAGHFQNVPAAKRHLLLNGVDPADFPQAGEGSGARKIVMVASLNRAKGQDLLLEAFSKLPQKDVELYFYGTTGLSAHGYVRSLRAKVKERGLEGRVFFPGPTPDIRSVLKGSTLLVHTSWKESFGMALVEAMASGVPVIAHELGGMQEVVADGVSGFLVPAGDVEILADRIQRVLDDEALRKRLGAAGRALVRERYSMPSRAKEYASLCRELCRAGSVR